MFLGSLNNIHVKQYMARCEFCRKRSHLDMQCKWCKKAYCIACLQAEVHKCLNTEDMKNEQHLILENRLLREKVVGEKLLKM